MDGSLKLLLTALTASTYWYSLTPPNYPSRRDKITVDGVFGFVAHALSLASKVAVISSLVCQMIIITAISHPSPLSSAALKHVCHSPNPLPITSISPLFLAGSLLVIAMALVRAWCYHALGTLFTFQITIRNDHRLVRTGPYAYVRHPAYTSLILVLVGVIAMSLDNNGWIRQCDMMKTQVGWWVYAYIWLCLFSIRSMLRRGEIEDAELKNVFHSDWVMYSCEVPYRFLPGII